MIEQFHRPKTIREALGLKRKLQARAAFLAGGTFLNSKDSTLHPEHCISLEGLGLNRSEKKDGDVIIGALCTLQQLIEDKKTPEPLKEAALQVVSRNIRNLATIGGHIARNPATSDLIPMLAALDARVGFTGSGAARTMPILDYLLSGEDVLITKIIIPDGYRKRPAACANLRGSANARSVLSAAVSLALSRSTIKDPIIALSGVTRHVVRLTPVERALQGAPPPAVDEIAGMVSRCVRPGPTIFESAAYKRHQAGEIVASALYTALGWKGGRG